MTEMKYPGFTLELEDPVIVTQSDTFEKLRWGPCQFPSLKYTYEGNIVCTWNTGADSITAYEDSADGYLHGGMMTSDGGKTWQPRRREERARGLIMSNGKEYVPAESKNAYVPDWLSKYTPVLVGKKEGTAIYEPGSIPEYDTDLFPGEYDPSTGSLTRFKAEVNWPHHGMHCCNHEGVLHLYPYQNILGNMPQIISDGEGGMFMVTYTYGYSAETGELLSADAYNIYIFRSTDNGRTWNWHSEVLTTPDYYLDDPHWEGFCEPFVCKMPDGSHLMLLRTGGGLYSYKCRSTDNCRTWSKPVPFDRVGVYPVMLSLECGVTLASYGRPGVFLRATSDPTGLTWERPIDFEIGTDSGRTADTLMTCSYTSMVPLGENEALMAYSHFRYPNSEGVPVKTILSRRIRIIK